MFLTGPNHLPNIKGILVWTKCLKDQIFHGPNVLWIFWSESNVSINVLDRTKYDQILRTLGMDKMSYEPNVFWTFWTKPNVLQDWKVKKNKQLARSQARNLHRSQTWKEISIIIMKFMNTKLKNAKTNRKLWEILERGKKCVLL